MSLKDALKFIEKEHASAIEAEGPLEVLSTGSLAVDIITGRGGFPRGKLSEVFGWEYSGKTTLCVSACAEAQRRGLYVAYVDAEKGLDLRYASKLGFIHDDRNKGLYLTPDTFEDTVVIVDKLVASGEVPLVVVDSVPGMVPKATFEGEISETGAIGATARLLSSVLPRLTKTIAENNTALVLVNQMRMKVSTGWQPAFVSRDQKEESSGGSALKFYSSLRVDMAIVKKGSVKTRTTDFFTGKDIEVSMANVHQAKIIKNKISSPYRSCQFTIRYDEDRGLYGIDNVATLLGIAVVQGLIKRTGAHYKCTLPDGQEFNSHGEDALFDFVLAHPKIKAALWAEVQKIPGVTTALREV